MLSAQVLLQVLTSATTTPQQHGWTKQTLNSNQPPAPHSAGAKCQANAMMLSFMSILNFRVGILLIIVGGSSALLSEDLEVIPMRVHSAQFTILNTLHRRWPSQLNIHTCEPARMTAPQAAIFKVQKISRALELEALNCMQDPGSLQNDDWLTLCHLANLYCQIRSFSDILSTSDRSIIEI